MKDLTPTPHIEAKKGEIAKTIILCGDAKRTRFIAERFLTNVSLVNSVRNNYCFTGVYKGKRISIMSVGMGNASMGIYSYELFNFYGVENAIRLGTIGSLNKDYILGDIVAAESVMTSVNYNNLYAEKGECELLASQELVKKFKDTAKLTKKKVKFGKIYSSDTFYAPEEEIKRQISLGNVGVEMESAALYLNAQMAGKKALCVCMVSDEILTGKKYTSEERQTKVLDAAKLVLDLAIEL